MSLERLGQTKNVIGNKLKSMLQLTIKLEILLNQYREIVLMEQTLFLIM